MELTLDLPVRVGLCCALENEWSMQSDDVCLSGVGGVDWFGPAASARSRCGSISG